MLAEDFKPNRLSASKDVALDFIDGRKNDRFGLVVYSGESFTQCPLTTDHDIVINMMKKVRTGLIDDGTAIGLGLANCVNRLKDSKADSKIIILLTDGENNSGVIDPISAANIARKYNIKTYTIGVGSYGTAPYPGEDVFGRPTYYNVPSNTRYLFRTWSKSRLSSCHEQSSWSWTERNFNSFIFSCLYVDYRHPLKLGNFVHHK